MTQLSVVWTYLVLQADRLRQLHDEQGAVTLEQILVAAILAATAITAGGILYELAVSKAHKIGTDTP
ncbi:MAG TPA: hypothetical protein VFJ85_14650 [Acidimicrobiales bacterium]|nr:hypothetical protein [Acidimicrobiales bacterium]